MNIPRCHDRVRNNVCTQIVRIARHKDIDAFLIKVPGPVQTRPGPAWPPRNCLRRLVKAARTVAYRLQSVSATAIQRKWHVLDGATPLQAEPAGDEDTRAFAIIQRRALQHVAQYTSCCKSRMCGGIVAEGIASICAATRRAQQHSTAWQLPADALLPPPLTAVSDGDSDDRPPKRPDSRGNDGAPGARLVRGPTASISSHAQCDRLLT